MNKIKSHRHFLLFKPYGYLSQFKSNARHEANKKFLGSLYDFPENIMAIGRLDKTSEGLLMLTTNGKMSAHVNGMKVEKEYYVQVDGLIDDASIDVLMLGVTISVEGLEYHTKPCKVSRLAQSPDLPLRAKKIRDERHGPTTWLSISLNEGKFHQVRKMTAAIGFPTLRLVRVRIGDYRIENMKAGDVKEITEELIL